MLQGSYFAVQQAWDYIGTMHLAMHFSFLFSRKDFFLTLVSHDYVTDYQARGLSGHTSLCSEFACFLKDYTFQKSTVGTLHQETNLFCLRAPCILRTISFFNVDD